MADQYNENFISSRDLEPDEPLKMISIKRGQGMVRCSLNVKPESIQHWLDRQIQHERDRQAELIDMLIYIKTNMQDCNSCRSIVRRINKCLADNSI